MNKNSLVFVAAVSLAAVSGSVFAKHGFQDSARVVWVKPIYETVEVSRPVESCWEEEAYRASRDGHSYTPVIVGAIVGGVVGNQFGKGRGKDAMTAAGALLGASVGSDISRQRGSGYVTTRTRCEMVDNYEYREELVGYRVKYRYKGNTYWTRTRHHPGESLRVRVNVEPWLID